MSTKAINPYPLIGEKHKESLDFIIANLPANPTFENLNDVLVSSLFTPDPAFPVVGDFASLMLLTVLPNTYNGYVNGGLGSYVKYTDDQYLIVNQLLQGIKSVPVEAIG